MPPERGEANRSVIKILAKALGINPKFISIVGGETSPNKVLVVNGMANWLTYKNFTTPYQAKYDT